MEVSALGLRTDGGEVRYEQLAALIEGVFAHHLLLELRCDLCQCGAPVVVHLVHREASSCGWLNEAVDKPASKHNRQHTGLPHGWLRCLPAVGSDQVHPVHLTRRGETRLSLAAVHVVEPVCVFVRRQAERLGSLTFTSAIGLARSRRVERGSALFLWRLSGWRCILGPSVAGRRTGDQRCWGPRAQHGCGASASRRCATVNICVQMCLGLVGVDGWGLHRGPC
mmetsp:Transcript_3441/g.8514  ORF Transcript_3441/g.8514 Transcript_3441/m.8514 type:complete len:224 (+) Transcript_3441:1187-1858(+)